MSKLILLFVLTAVVAASVVAFPQDLPSSSTAAPNNCQPNSMPITSRGDTSCVLNCANYAGRLTMSCTKILNFGNFCRCNEGFVFKNGAAGECVRIADCPN